MTHVLSNRCRIFLVTRNPLKRKNEFTPIVVDVLNVDGIVFNHYKINKLDNFKSFSFHLWIKMNTSCSCTRLIMGK